MANIKLRSFNVGENVIISNSGQISIINLSDIITSDGFPAAHPKLSVLVRIMGDVGKYEEKIEVVSLADNKVLAEVKGTIEIKKSDEGSNFNANFVNMVFPAEGKYWFKVSVSGEVMTDGSLHFVELRKS